MKFNNFLMTFAVIAVVSMSSCSQEEELVVPDSQFSDNAIAFATYIGKNPAARGTSTTTATLQKSGEGFGVMAYYTKTADFDNTAKPNFMYNQQVKYTDDVWTYSPVKYWPNNAGDKLSFFAYAPYRSTFGETGITALSGNTEAGDPTLTFKMDTDVSKHIDLLYADAETTEATETTKANKIIDLTKPDATGKVNLKFKHALARVSFSRQMLIDELTNENLDENTSITIDKVTFSPDNLATEGILNLHTGAWSVNSDAYKTMDYVLDSFTDNSNKLEGASATTAAELTATNGYILLIPEAQTTRSGAATGNISIDYTVTTTDTNLADGEIVVTNTKTVPFDFTFAAGKAYNFVLKIGLTSVKIDAIVTDWVDGDMTEWGTNTVF